MLHPSLVHKAKHHKYFNFIIEIQIFAMVFNSSKIPQFFFRIFQVKNKFIFIKFLKFEFSLKLEKLMFIQFNNAVIILM